MRLDGPCPLDAPDAPQRLAEDFRFIADLRLIRHVLVLAAAAASKVRAGSRHALRRGFQDVVQTSADKFLFASGGFYSNEFAGKDQRHKYRLAVMMRQAVTAIHEFFDSNFHLESLSNAGGTNFGRGPQVR